MRRIDSRVVKVTPYELRARRQIIYREAQKALTRALMGRDRHFGIQQWVEELEQIAFLLGEG